MPLLYKSVGERVRKMLLLSGSARETIVDNRKGYFLLLTDDYLVSKKLACLWILSSKKRLFL